MIIIAINMINKNLRSDPIKHHKLL